MNCKIKAVSPDTTKYTAAAVFLLSWLVSAIVLYECFGDSYIADEIFTLKLIRYSVPELVAITAADVHPPLYYLVLKFFVEAGRCAGLSAVHAAKLCSFVPIMLLQLYAWLCLRKRAELSAALYSLMLVIMPKFTTFGTQLRMYSWGMFFVTAAYLGAERLITEGKVSVRRGLALVAFSLCAAYTQYFALIAVIPVFLCLFLFYLIKNRPALKSWLVWVLICTACYVPWLSVAVKQVIAVNKGYWIEPVSLPLLLDYFQYIFNPNVYVYHSGTIVGALLFALVMARFAHAAAHGEAGVYQGLGLFVPAFVVVLGVAVSLVSQPVLADRYIFLGMGAFWFAAADLFGKERTARRWLSVFFVVLLVNLWFNTTWFMRTEREYREGWRGLFEAVNESLAPGDLILANDGNLAKLMSENCPEHTVGYYWRQKLDDVFVAMYPNLESLRKPEDILALMQEGGTLWLLDLEAQPEFHFLSDLSAEQAAGLEYENVGTYDIEGLKTTVWRVRRG